MKRIQFVASLFMLVFSMGVCAQESTKKPFLSIQNWETQNGVKVYFVETPALPVVDMEILFDAGSSREGEKFGLASLTNAVLFAGGATDSFDSIAEGFSSIGAEITGSASKDMAHIRLRTLSDAAAQQKALGLVEKLLKPAFKADNFAQEQSRTLRGIQQKQDYPDEITDDLFYNTLYAGHPYAHNGDGTEETVKKLTAKDLQTFFDQYYVAKNATFVIVGALDKPQATQLAEKLSAALKQGKKADALSEPKMPASTAAQKSMETQQTHLVYGTLGVARTDLKNNKTWPALFLGNQILGGGTFDSRLFVNVREKAGLAYSVGSYFSPMKTMGPWMASVQTRNEKSGEALDKIKSLVDDFIKNGPTDAEVENAKVNIINRFPISFRSNDDIVYHVAIIGFYGLSLTYYDELVDAFEKVKTEDIKQAFKNQFAEHNFVTVIVGQEQNKDVKTPKHVS